MSEGLDLDSILGAMEDAAVAEKKTGNLIVKVLERQNIKDTIGEAQEFIEDAEFKEFSHDDSFLDHLQDVDLVVFECRLLEGLADLRTIGQIRMKRPQLPVLVFSANDDVEFISSVLEEGAADCLPVGSEWLVVSAKMKNLLKISKTLSLFEFKNEEVIKTMRSLREVNDAMKHEKMNRIMAETERDFAEEAAQVNRQMKEILDNLQEGFFFVNKELMIGSSTSAACEEIFGDSLAERQLGTILNLCEPEKEKHLCLALEQIFDDFMPEEVSVSMLPKTVETNCGKIVDLRYTVVRANDQTIEKVIIAASDISEIVKERKEIEAKFIENRSLINILRHIDGFRDFVAAFRKSITLIRGETDKLIIKRELHTLKGNSLSFELYELGDIIHHTETAFIEDEGLDLTVELDKIETNLLLFLKVHKELLKVDYTEQQVRLYSISETDFAKLVSYSESIPSDHRGEWDQLMKKIHCKQISEICSNFAPSVQRLANKLEKKIDFSIEGDGHQVDADIYHDLLQNLIHLINNACDHGIEMPVEREASDKDDVGQINLRFNVDENQSLQITLTDDGKGIDWQKLMDTAHMKGYSLTLIEENITRETAYKLLFLDGFSTAEKISETSGRGVGMAALKAEVEALNGTIIVESEIGKGTKTTITIPDQGLRLAG
ncbi:MAG: hypothetical protein HRU19_13410 [Pseudobacteriovorax sp.]|nr:hypothetical protein [Pseudobacteriovorax sp.]